MFAPKTPAPSGKDRESVLARMLKQDPLPWPHIQIAHDMLCTRTHFSETRIFQNEAEVLASLKAFQCWCRPSHSFTPLFHSTAFQMTHFIFTCYVLCVENNSYDRVFYVSKLLGINFKCPHPLGSSAILHCIAMWPLTTPYKYAQQLLVHLE